MPNFDRRAFLGTMALAGTVPVAARAAQSLEPKDIAKEADNACLYHCDFGDPPRFVQMLTNISNHYAAYGADPFALQLAIVAHGPGVKFFLETLDGTTWRDEVMVPAIFEKVEAVAKNGLRIYLCSITFERLKLDKARARQAPYIAFVPSGVATVGALQNKGFAYIKIG
ncbi:DsrE family protein [Xanthobacter autotrophicus]|uniref:DsrE family protein n=1 Tax=Xanthobacter autotrophicus TaxID=280 RepID=UPI003727B4C1